MMQEKLKLTEMCVFFFLFHNVIVFINDVIIKLISWKLIFFLLCISYCVFQLRG